MKYFELNLINLALTIVSVGARKRRSPDVFDNLKFNSSEGLDTEKYSRFKETFKHQHFFRCPRNLIRIGNPFDLNIKMYSKGYTIVKPTIFTLSSMSALFRKLATKTITNSTSKATTKTFDTQCTNRPAILKRLRMYHNETRVREGIGYYTVKDLPAGILQTVYEMLTFTVTCKFTEHELDGLLSKYISLATGADINECETKFCTLPPIDAKNLAIQWVAGLWVLFSGVFLWYTCLRKTFTVTNRKNCRFMVREVFEFFSPPTAQRLVQRMENLDKRSAPETWTRNRHDSISIDLTSSDDSDIYTTNHEVKTRKKRDTREKKIIVSGFAALVLTMTYVGLYLNTPETIQTSLCNFLDKIRSKIL